MLELEQIQALDHSEMLGSIDALNKQVEHAWKDVNSVSIPESYKDVDHVMLFGMGGSALGMHVIQSVFSSLLKVPVTIHNNYHIPAWVNKRTLVVLSSYSGTTEEVVEVSKTIKERTEKIMVITTGGKLQEAAEENNWPMYMIDPIHNPCGQPRIAVGYATTGLIGLLKGAGVLDVTDQEIDDISHFLEGNRELLRDDALKVAETINGSMAVYVGSEFLAGNAHIVANQTNENGKHAATYYLLPELNHHLLEGLSYPEGQGQKTCFVFIESHLYHARNQKRYAVTKQVLDKQKITHATFIPTASTELLQAFEVMQWGAYVAFYTAIHNGIDPSPIPWVDFFKDALKKPV